MNIKWVLKRRHRPSFNLVVSYGTIGGNSGLDSTTVHLNAGNVNCMHAACGPDNSQGD